MFLVPVVQHATKLHFLCARCGRTVDNAHADMEGPSYRGYFCAVCTVVLEDGLDPTFRYPPEKFP